jgi:hypothetical protein
MRKALIGLIMAATVLTPIVAQAQDRGGRNRHEQREDNRGNGGGGGEQRAQRQEARQQRQQQRVQVQQQAQQPQQQQVQIAQRERRGGGSWQGNGGNRGGDRGNWRGGDNNRGNDGNRGNWRGNDGNRGGDRGQTRNSTVQGWGGPNTPEYREHAQRYNRRAQENALRYGTQEQRRDVYRQRRGDRDGNWRGDRDGNWRGDRDRNWQRDGRRNWSGDWNRGWRNDRRYDWNRWRYSNRNIFHLSPYYSPYRNHRYSRFSIGFFLDSLFYDQRYWIGDPWSYRLPPAPPGTQWIRYYNDVLLVDVYSGEVVDVIHDFFW